MSREKADKLKRIALEGSMWEERLKAIELLGELGDEAFDALSDVALNGRMWEERHKALEMIEKIFRGKKA